MTIYTPNEPTLCATRNLGTLLGLAALVQRRRIVVPIFGLAIDSEIALPGDADYPLTNAGFDASRLFRSSRTSPLGLIDESDNVPAAWVFPSTDASRARFVALSGGQQGPGRTDDNPIAARLAIATKMRDDGSTDAILTFQNRTSDLLRRIEAEHAALGIDNMSMAFDEPVPAYDPDSQWSYVITSAAISHTGERVVDVNGVAISVWSSDTSLDTAEANVAGATLTLSGATLDQSVIINDQVTLDGLSMTTLVAAIIALGHGWQAVTMDARLTDYPATFLLDQTTPSNIIGPANQASLVVGPVL